MDGMTKEEKIAFEWALSQTYQSVAASYARISAKYIERKHKAVPADLDVIDRAIAEHSPR